MANFVIIIYLIDVKNKKIYYYRLNDEVDNVIGSKVEINNEDLNQMVYLNATYKEALRKWPPGSVLNREADEDIIYNGYIIPKGAWLVVIRIYH